MSVNVKYKKWSFVMNDEELTMYGSPYFSESQVGKYFYDRFRSELYTPIQDTVKIPYEVFICANEAFPESALNDPIADLKLYDQWRNNTRQFPYVGKYLPLGISKQDSKTQNSGSVGVFGEVLAGMFIQHLVSPSFIVRPIRHWPDFIVLNGEGRFVFSESKAFIISEQSVLTASQPIPEKLLKEFFYESMRQLLADPSVILNGFFVGIESIEPLNVSVWVIDVRADEIRLSGYTNKILPEVVKKEVLVRAIERLLYQRYNEKGQLLELLERMRVHKLDVQDEMYISDLVTDLRDNMKELLKGDFDPILEAIQSSELRKLLFESVKNIDTINENSYFLQVKTDGKVRSDRNIENKTVDGVTFLKLRDITNHSIYMADINEKDLQDYENSWQSDIKTMGKAFKGMANTYIMGGALFHVSERDSDSRD
ncbi:MAG: hypothetical protein KDC55_11205 [Ignavibacteriae bacterium]|nr:hypothetical protein [Ignavibacteriota bacterium]